MKKIILTAVVIILLTSCAKTEDREVNVIEPTGEAPVERSMVLEIEDTKNQKMSEQDFGSGIVLFSDETSALLNAQGKTILRWDEGVKIRVESFDTRFYKVYRDLDNDFQIWLYDSVSGNIHEFGNGNMGDIIEKIGVTENAINISTKYSDSKVHLNENPYNFPLGKIVGMYLTFLPDFSKLSSWQYKEYDRKITLETDKEILMEYLKKQGRSNFTIDNFELKGIYFKNAAYVGGLNSGCFQDGNDQICMVPKFFVVIDNDGMVAYFEETNGDYECKDIEKSLSGKVLESVGKKFCPN